MSRQDEELFYNGVDYSDGVVQQEYATFVQDNIHELDKRYWKAALDPHSSNALFEQIGEDFSSPSEEIRKKAFEAVYIAYDLCGKLADCLDERETYQPGWRHERGKDQHFINRRIDILTKLYEELVIRGAFQSEKRKDPRPYIHQTIANWKINQYRRDKRLVHLDDEEWEGLIEHPPTDLAEKLSESSAEDEAIHLLEEEMLSRELIEAGYLTKREFNLFHALYVEEIDSEALAHNLEVTPGAVRQDESKHREKMILRRDLDLFIRIAGSIPDALSWVNNRPLKENPLSSDVCSSWFARRIEEALKPTLKASRALEKVGIAPIFFPLTAEIGRRPARLYIYCSSDKFAAQHYPKRLFDPTNYYSKNEIRKGLSVKVGGWDLPFVYCQIMEYIFLPNNPPIGFPLLDEIVEQVLKYGYDGIKRSFHHKPCVHIAFIISRKELVERGLKLIGGIYTPCYLERDGSLSRVIDNLSRVFGSFVL